MFVEQYKFNSEIVPDREQLQRMTKKPSESSGGMRRGGAKLLLKSSQS